MLNHPGSGFSVGLTERERASDVRMSWDLSPGAASRAGLCPSAELPRGGLHALLPVLCGAPRASLLSSAQAW